MENLLVALGCNPSWRRYHRDHSAPTSSTSRDTQLALLSSGGNAEVCTRNIEHYTTLDKSVEPLPLLNLLTGGRFSLSPFELQQKLIKFLRQDPTSEYVGIAQEILRDFSNLVWQGAGLLRIPYLPLLAQLMLVSFVICRVTEKGGIRQYQVLDSDTYGLPRNSDWPTVFLAEPRPRSTIWAIFSSVRLAAVDECTLSLLPLQNKHRSAVAVPGMGRFRGLYEVEVEQMAALYLRRAAAYFAQAEAIDKISHVRALVYYAKAHDDYKSAFNTKKSREAVFGMVRCLLKQSQAQKALDLLREKNNPSLGLGLSEHLDYYFLGAVAFRLKQRYAEASSNIIRCLQMSLPRNPGYQSYLQEMSVITGLIGRCNHPKEAFIGFVPTASVQPQLCDDSDKTASYVEGASEPYHILSLDGGRGMFTAVLLHELERELGGKLVDRFNLVAGSGVGGAIALLLSSPKPVRDQSTHQVIGYSSTEPHHSAADILKLYSNDEGRQGLLPTHTSFWGSKNTKRKQEDVVRQWTAKAKMSDLLNPVVIPVSVGDKPYASHHIFSNVGCRTDYDVADVILSSLSSPDEGYPMWINGRQTPCWDSGYCANNPAEVAFHHATTVRADGHPIESNRVYVWSFGSGDYVSSPFMAGKDREWLFACGRSRSCPLGGQQNNVEDSLPQKLYDVSRYQRFQFWLSGPVKPTDQSEDTLAFLKNAAHDVVESSRVEGPWQRMVDYLSP